MKTRCEVRVCTVLYFLVWCIFWFGCMIGEDIRSSGMYYKFLRFTITYCFVIIVLYCKVSLSATTEKGQKRVASHGALKSSSREGSDYRHVLICICRAIGIDIAFVRISTTIQYPNLPNVYTPHSPINPQVFPAKSSLTHFRSTPLSDPIVDHFNREET